MDGLYWKTLLKWMIWGYHYFWKHPNVAFWFLLPKTPLSVLAKRVHRRLDHRWLDRLGGMYEASRNRLLAEVGGHSGDLPGGGWMWGWGLGRNHVLPWRSRKENLRPLDDLERFAKENAFYANERQEIILWERVPTTTLKKYSNGVLLENVVVFSFSWLITHDSIVIWLFAEPWRCEEHYDHINLDVQAFTRELIGTKHTFPLKPNKTYRPFWGRSKHCKSTIILMDTVFLKVMHCLGWNLINSWSFSAPCRVHLCWGSSIPTL